MKRFLRRWLIFAALVYAALWVATYAIGGRQVREITLAELEIKPHYRHIPFDTQRISEFPAYGYSIVSYVPCLVTARYMVWWNDEGAAGGTSIYFWLGVPRRPFRVYDWRV